MNIKEFALCLSKSWRTFSPQCSLYPGVPFRYLKLGVADWDMNEHTMTLSLTSD